MSGDQDKPQLHVPARTLPVPLHVSPQLQDVLCAPGFSLPPFPALSDKEGWRAHAIASDAILLETVKWQLEGVRADVREIREGDALAYDVRPEGVSDNDRRVMLDIHGGALLMGADEVCRAMAVGLAGRMGCRVVAVDYRMPPDHPYPVGLDDCIAIYRALLRDHAPEEIIVEGLSAGGNVAPAMILKARDQGLPLPAAAVLLSPECDLTETGDSFFANNGVDTALSPGLMPINELYADGEELTHPYVSPLYGDFAKGFPPSLIAAGTRDLFLSNAVRLHRAMRKAGVAADLHIIEAAHHGAMGADLPEIAELDREIRAFCAAHWPQ
ncbi:MAG: alpha/beta hydrolase [Novosphingobium sp.]|nr:alpha/beta hydrolase [Novosphingobium sp.]